MRDCVCSETSGAGGERRSPGEPSSLTLVAWSVFSVVQNRSMSSRARGAAGGRERGRGGSNGRKNNIRGGKVVQKNGDPLYSEKMGRQLKPDEVAVLAREVERLSEKERALVEREKRMKEWEENAQHSSSSNENSPRDPKARARQLWNKAREGVKPATLSEKLRNAEKAIAILAGRLESAGLSSDVNGKECSDSKEVAKLREENEALAMKLQLANGRSAGADPAMKAAAAADKRARDLKASLASLQDKFNKQAKELELSCQAGATAREEVQRLKAELRSKEQSTESAEMLAQQKASAKQELESIAAKIKSLEKEKRSLNERLKGAETDAARLRVELKEQRSRLKQLDEQRNGMTSKKELEKLDADYKMEKEKVKQLSTQLEKTQALTDELNALKQQLMKETERLQVEQAEKLKLQERNERQSEEIEGLSQSLRHAELEKNAMREATRASADAAAMSIESVQQVTESLRRDIDELRTDKEKLTELNHTLFDENKELRSENDDLKLAASEHVDFNSQSLELHGQIQGLKRELETLRKSKLAAEEQLAEQKQLEDGLRAEHVALGKQAGTMKASLETMMANNIALQEEVAVLKDAAASTTPKKARQAVIDGMTQHIAELTQILALKEDALVESAVQLKDSEGALRTLKHESDTTAEELKQTKSGLVAAQVQLRQYASELKTLQGDFEGKCQMIRSLEKQVHDTKHQLAVNQEQFRKTLQDQNVAAREVEADLRKDVETLAGQLGSLIENGEEFKANVNRREAQYRKQIEELQGARKKDVAAFSKVRSAASAWQQKAKKGKANPTIAGSQSAIGRNHGAAPTTLPALQESRSSASVKGKLTRPGGSLSNLQSLSGQENIPAAAGPARALTKREQQYAPRTPPRSGSAGSRPVPGIIADPSPS